MGKKNYKHDTLTIGGKRGGGGKGEGRDIMVFQDISLPMNCQGRGERSWILTPTLFFFAETNDQSIRKVLKALRGCPKPQSDRLVTGLASANMFTEERFSRVLPPESGKNKFFFAFRNHNWRQRTEKKYSGSIFRLLEFGRFHRFSLWMILFP